MFSTAGVNGCCQKVTKGGNKESLVRFSEENPKESSKRLKK